MRFVPWSATREAEEISDCHAGIMPLPDDEVTNRLKAVVVTEPDAVVGAEQLRQHCAVTLPRYMVPETIEFRTTLPGQPDPGLLRQPGKGGGDDLAVRLAPDEAPCVLRDDRTDGALQRIGGEHAR